MKHSYYLLGSVILLSFLLGSCKKDDDTPDKEEENNELCFGMSSGNQYTGYKVTAFNFWEAGASFTFTFMGESGSTSQITNMSTNVTITATFSNIRYSGGVSSFNLKIDGGKYSNKSYSYPADRCY